MTTDFSALRESILTGVAESIELVKNGPGTTQRLTYWIGMGHPGINVSYGEHASQSETYLEQGIQLEGIGDYDEEYDFHFFEDQDFRTLYENYVAGFQTAVETHRSKLDSIANDGQLIIEIMCDDYDDLTLLSLKKYRIGSRL